MFLEAVKRVSGALDADHVARELIDQAVPGLADFGSVHLSGVADGSPAEGFHGGVAPLTLRRAAVAYRRRTRRWNHVPVDAVVQYRPDHVLTHFLLAAEPVLVPRVGEADLARLPAHFDNPITRLMLRDCSLLVVPLNARGAVLGFAALARGPGRDAFDASDLAAVRRMTDHAALRIDNARLRAREAQAALILQSSMLPTCPPALPPYVETAHRYLPCDADDQVGGDWFDVIALPGPKVALVIGDVMGHGLHAAVVMLQLRTAVQTLSALDLPPDEVVRQLSHLAQRLGDAHLATCVYCVYDPATRRCTLANAGHPPPILVHPATGAAFLPVPAGLPLGVDARPCETAEADIPEGGVLGLYTDGLVERRGQDIDVGLAVLNRAMGVPAASLDAACSAVLDALDVDQRRDDATLVLARLS
jgi:hypothetical protein